MFKYFDKNKTYFKQIRQNKINHVSLDYANPQYIYTITMNMFEPPMQNYKYKKVHQENNITYTIHKTYIIYYNRAIYPG